MGKISEDDYIGAPALVPFEYAAQACLKAQEYQEAQYYKKALQKYGYALVNYEIFFRFCDERDKNIVSFKTEIKLLFLMLNFVDQVKKCYAELNEPYKSLVFQKKFEEIVKTIGKHEKALNPEQFIAYKNITKALESIYEEIPLAEFSKTTLEDKSQVADNSDDPLFRELVENYDKCCSYKTLLVPSKGVSFSSSSISSTSSSTSSSSSCFIATAAYSTAIHPDIDTFRNFRDKKLLTNPLGQKLVSLYYNISPSIANYVKRQPVIKRFLRQQLERLAEWMRSREVKSW